MTKIFNNVGAGLLSLLFAVDRSKFMIDDAVKTKSQQGQGY